MQWYPTSRSAVSSRALRSHFNIPGMWRGQDSLVSSSPKDVLNSPCSLDLYLLLRDMWQNGTYNNVSDIYIYGFLLTLLSKATNNQSFTKGWQSQPCRVTVSLSGAVRVWCQGHFDTQLGGARDQTSNRRVNPLYLLSYCCPMIIMSVNTTLWHTWREAADV